jgi:tetratricopeptide (TPR) repeat protein
LAAGCARAGGVKRDGEVCDEGKRREDGRDDGAQRDRDVSDATAARGPAVDPHALLEQVGRALDYLHSNGLVHSDLKPSNVFQIGDHYKLTDFGLVQRARGGTRREANYGTIAYMPPERLRAQEGPPDAREDLYALGAILYEVLCGRAPYSGDTADATVERILAGDLERELAEVPEAWARLLRRLLASDPADRFESAWDLLQSWRAQFDRPQPAPRLVSPPFVGRRRELASVRTALADAARGRGTLLYAEGGPGVGKTALLESAASQAAAFGMSCWRIEAPAAPHPGALVEELSELYRRWAPGLPVSLRDVAEQLTAWPAAVQAATTDEDVLNAHAHALGALQQVAAIAPHVLILDDAHRFDRSSRALVRFLACYVRDLGIVVLAAGRTAVSAYATGVATMEDVEALGHELATVRREGAAVTMLPLHQLGAEDVATLVRRRFDSGQELEPLAQRVFELTQGHAFFVAEALQHLIATGQLRRQPGGWTLQPQAETKLLPRMADTILDEHLVAAGSEDRRVFETLSLFPAGAAPEVLGRVLERPADGVRRALERGVRLGLLATSGESYRFGHELIREACAARCPVDAARVTHQRIADVLEGTAAEAHHRLSAEERTARSRACFLREAQAYEARRALWEALRFYAAALEIDPAIADADELALRVALLQVRLGAAEEAAALLLRRLPAVRDRLLQGRYLRQLGLAYGSRGRNEEALARLRQANALLSQHAGNDEYHALAADLVHILLTKGETSAAIAECARALDALPEEAPLLRVKLLLLQGQAERQDGNYAAAEATCRVALDVLKPLGRTLEMAQAYTQIGTNYAYRHDYEQAERFYRAALRVHQDLGDLHGMKSAYNNLGSALMRADKLDESIHSYQQSLDLKRRLGDRPGEGSSLNNLGNLWERRADWRRAFQCYRRGVSIYRRLHRPRELTTLYHNMGEVLLRLGRLQRAARLLERAQMHATGIGGAYIAQMVAINLGATRLALYDVQGCFDVLEMALPGMQRSGLPGVTAQAHAVLALAAASHGDRVSAATHEEAALAALGTAAEEEARLETLLFLAETAMRVGRTADAEQRARSAEELAERTARPYPRVRALRIRAQTSQARGDWDVAEAQIEQAAALCRDLGFRHELAKCYKSLGSLHWDIGLRARAEDEYGQCLELLTDLGLRTELGLVYLELARRAS